MPSRWTEGIKATSRMDMMVSICATMAHSYDQEVCVRTLRNRYIQMGMALPEIEEAIEIALRLSWIGQSEKEQR